MKARKDITIALLIGSTLGALAGLGVVSRDNAKLSADYEAVLVADNRMTRSRSNFALPAFGPEELKANKQVSEALLWPWEMSTAIEKTENGGRLLEVGAQSIPDDIRRAFPPQLWQRAAAVRIMQQVAGRMVLEDPEVAFVFADRLARRWNAKDVPAWRTTFITALIKLRGEGEGVRPAQPIKKTKAGRNKR